MSDNAPAIDGVAGRTRRPRTSAGRSRTCTPMRAAARKVGRRFAQIAPIVATYRKLEAARGDLEAARELGDDDDVVRRRDPRARGAASTNSSTQLTDLLAPRDPHDADDVVLEVKSGEGGEESALFAADLARMYIRYAERHGWTVTVLDETFSDLGGYKDATLTIASKGDSADGVWSRLKFEGGVHRVQRVPVTESQGRVHTSAAGVLVYPEPEDVAAGPDRRVRPAHRRLPVVGQGRPGRQHHRLGGAHHAPAHRHRRHLPERALAAAEQGARDGGAGRPAAGARRGAGARPTRRPTGPARSAPSTAASASAPTTSRRTGSPTTGSTSRRTTSTRSSTVTSIRCSTRWPPPTSRPGCSRHDRRHSGSEPAARGCGAIDDAAGTLAAAGIDTAARRRRTARRAHRGRRPRPAERSTSPTSRSSTGYRDVIDASARRIPLQHLTATAAVRARDC